MHHERYIYFILVHVHIIYSLVQAQLMIDNLRKKKTEIYDKRFYKI